MLTAKPSCLRAFGQFETIQRRLVSFNLPTAADRMLTVSRHGPVSSCFQASNLDAANNLQCTKDDTLNQREAPNFLGLQEPYLV
jgi:hypothetical protein